MMNDIACCNCGKHLGRMSFNFAMDDYESTNIIKTIKYKVYVCTLLCDECAREEEQSTISLYDIPEQPKRGEVE